jgi:tRNA (cmo5U34)-methyltransferase
VASNVAGVGSQWHFDPDSYLAMVRAEIPRYDDLQRIVAGSSSSSGSAVRRILDLGSGTGVTAASVLAAHRGATLIGMDASEEMLRHARELVPEAEFLVGGLEGPLPPGEFDLVVSAFAVHHLDGPAKAALFERVAEALCPGGRFVLCDVVTPDVPVEHPVPLEEGVDLPSSVDDQLSWLQAAGLRPEVAFADDDLAVITADRP